MNLFNTCRVLNNQKENRKKRWGEWKSFPAFSPFSMQSGIRVWYDSFSCSYLKHRYTFWILNLFLRRRYGRGEGRVKRGRENALCMVVLGSRFWSFIWSATALLSHGTSNHLGPLLQSRLDLFWTLTFQKKKQSIKNSKMPKLHMTALIKPPTLFWQRIKWMIEQTESQSAEEWIFKSE